MRVGDFERQLWILDQKINGRGMLIDVALAKKAALACSIEKDTLDKRVNKITKGAITSGTQVARIKTYLSDLGVKIDNLKSDTIDLALLDSSLATEARTLLEARQRVSKSSTAKYLTVLTSVGPDKRLRGGLQFAGAARTARWAGRIFQPHNLPRPSRKWPEVQVCIRALMSGYADLLTDNVHQLCSDVARSIIIAKPGHELQVADYSSIEGRVLAWLAGEKWKLDSYARKEDLYVRSFQRMFGLDPDTKISDFERQQGKCFELSMGYEGGVGALLNSAPTYGVDVVALGHGAWGVAPLHVKKLAEKLYGYALKRRDPTPGLIGRKLYIQLEAAKIMWRNISPETVRIWKSFNNAAIAAIENPGKKYKAGKCIFQRTEVPNTLTIKLPSGRLLFYSNPKISSDKSGKKKTITYASIYGGREFMYGGKLAENITQAIARDILGFAMIKTDAAGYPIILHVHDEIIAEVKMDGKLTLEMLCEIMADKPIWAAGLPIVAEGFKSQRYRKN